MQACAVKRIGFHCFRSANIDALKVELLDGTKSHVLGDEDFEPNIWIDLCDDKPVTSFEHKFEKCTGALQLKNGKDILLDLNTSTTKSEDDPDWKIKEVPVPKGAKVIGVQYSEGNSCLFGFGLIYV